VRILFSLVLVIIFPSTVPESGSERWGWPLSSSVQVERYFDLPHGHYGAGHRGIDLNASTGTTVRAPAAGIVTFVGEVVDRPVLTLRVADRYLVSFEPIVSELVAGETVKRGAVIGRVGTGGHCERSCLHVGIRENGFYRNPAGFFGELRPRLLPLWNDLQPAEQRIVRDLIE